MIAPCTLVSQSRRRVLLATGLIAHSLLVVIGVVALIAPRRSPDDRRAVATAAGDLVPWRCVAEGCPDPAALAVTDVPLLERRIAEFEGAVRVTEAALARVGPDQSPRLRREVAGIKQLLGKAHRWAACARQLQRRAD